MGGWGVDALLGRQTRPHKDLDVLVLVDDLPDLDRVLGRHDFTRTLVWEEENRWLEIDGRRLPTAFVATDPAGRELDVHVVEITSRGHVVVLCDVPWRLDANALDGRGRIGGVEVACVSADAQIAMHDGYDLPDTHRRDVALLQELRHAADEDTAPKP
jgi:lincosamide nucleotidyltransferase A/C/D/E